MKIRIENIVPTFISEPERSGSDVWERSLEFENNKIYSLTAPSGKGKTTLIKLIYGLINSYSGTLILDNLNYKNLHLNDFIKLWRNKFSIVFQDLRLFDDLSVFENIALNNKHTKFKVHDEILELLDLFDLFSKAHMKVKHLSLGQQQRVAIIRSFCQPFDMLLLDEPFSHLDNKNIDTTCQYLTDDIKKRKAGIIITSLGRNYFSTRTTYQI